MSVQQAEQLWQQSYTQQMDQYSSTFATDGWCVDNPDIPLGDILNIVRNAYVKNDAVCPEGFNGDYLDAIPSQNFRTLFVRDTLNNFTVGQQNGPGAVLDYILNNLAAGEGVDVENCAADPFDWSATDGDIDDRRI